MPVVSVRKNKEKKRRGTVPGRGASPSVRWIGRHRGRVMLKLKKNLLEYAPGTSVEGQVEGLGYGSLHAGDEARLRRGSRIPRTGRLPALGSRGRAREGSSRAARSCPRRDRDHRPLAGRGVRQGAPSGAHREQLLCAGHCA